MSPFTVFGANSKLPSITLLSGLLNAPLHPAPQIRQVSRRHCALYKFTYLLTYLITSNAVQISVDTECASSCMVVYFVTFSDSLHAYIIYRVAQKIVSYRTLSIFLLNIEQFSQFFHQ